MKGNPEIVWVNKSNEWTRQYSSVEMWFEWFRDCLTRKIFKKGPQPGHGNKNLRRRRMSTRHVCPVDGLPYIIQYYPYTCEACKRKGKRKGKK